jgi:hypothetical protein
MGNTIAFRNTRVLILKCNPIREKESRLWKKTLPLVIIILVCCVLHENAGHRPLILGKSYVNINTSLNGGTIEPMIFLEITWHHLLFPYHGIVTAVSFQIIFLWVTTFIPGTISGN